MPDIVNSATRTRMMSGIQSRNTKIEVTVRKKLFGRGYRYRINDKRLPGKPDLVLKRFKAVIFLHGCFWHGHDCPLFRYPSTNPDFWRHKIEGNQTRDKQSLQKLASLGWRIAVIWECALRGKKESVLEAIIDRTEDWLCSQNGYLEISA